MKWRNNLVVEGSSITFLLMRTKQQSKQSIIGILYNLGFVLKSSFPLAFTLTFSNLLMRLGICFVSFPFRFWHGIVVESKMGIKTAKSVMQC